MTRQFPPIDPSLVDDEEAFAVPRHLNAGTPWWEKLGVVLIVLAVITVCAIFAGA